MINWALQFILSLKLNFSIYPCVAFVWPYRLTYNHVAICVFLAACCLKNAEISVSISKEECLILVLPIKDHFQKNVYLKLRCSFYHFLLLGSLECLSLASKCFSVILYYIMSCMEARKLLLICVTHDPFLQYH